MNLSLRHAFSAYPGHRIHDVYSKGRRVCQIVRGWPSNRGGWLITGLGRLPNHGRCMSRGEAKRVIRRALRELRGG